MAQQRKDPSDFLKHIVGRPVIVKLNSGIEYRGILACLDGYMNIALEQTEEYVNGQLKCKYGDAFIRGNNGMLKVHAAQAYMKLILTYEELIIILLYISASMRKA